MSHWTFDLSRYHKIRYIDSVCVLRKPNYSDAIVRTLRYLNDTLECGTLCCDQIFLIFSQDTCLFVLDWTAGLCLDSFLDQRYLVKLVSAPDVS